MQLAQPSAHASQRGLEPPSTSTNPAAHTSQEPGPALSQVLHPVLHGSHRPCNSEYPSSHVAHIVVEPQVHVRHPRTEHEALRRDEERRDEEPPREEPLRAPCPTTSPASAAASASTRHAADRIQACLSSHGPVAVVQSRNYPPPF